MNEKDLQPFVPPAIREQTRARLRNSSPLTSVPRQEEGGCSGLARGRFLSFLVKIELYFLPSETFPRSGSYLPCP
jgi:hypothetical protein